MELIGFLETPQNLYVITEELRIAGWAISPAGISRVDVFINETFVGVAKYGEPRPDVAHVYPMPEALTSGFSVTLNVSAFHLSPGNKKVTVRVHACDGACLTFERTIEKRHISYAVESQYSSADWDEIKIIAFYLPQYHPIPENDEWWGRGFTEWTNVAKAQPVFEGHYQPHRPSELGYYDLRLPEVRDQQARLAREYGIHGFCYHHYWFGGKRLLERPFNEVLKYKTPSFPFALCWANENWTRRWDGAEHDLLIGQEHSPEDDLAFIRDIIPAFRDPRYIRIKGRPLLVVYRPALLPDPFATVTRWREECQRRGIGDIYVCAAQTFGLTDPRPYGFDAALQFPPHIGGFGEIGDRVNMFEPSLGHRVYEYERMAEIAIPHDPPSYTWFPGVVPSWDNSARKSRESSVYFGSSPDAYEKWLRRACNFVAQNLDPGERLIFVNAWNEWGEGCHLEPDHKYGRAFLEATRRVARPMPAPTKAPIVSVVIPVYNNALYVVESLDSVAQQTLKDIEIVVIDDGSRDDSLRVISEYAVKNPQLGMRVYSQANQGAHAALNNGIARAIGKYIAPLNADDIFEPNRLERMVDALEQSGSALAFSEVRFIDDDSRPLGPHEHETAKAIFEKQKGVNDFPSLIFATLDYNIAVSTGNFVFRRELFGAVGPFSALRYCHDWDFVLRSFLYTAPVYVQEELYKYRLHATNTFRSLGDVAQVETRIVLEGFSDLSARMNFGSTYLAEAGMKSYFEEFLLERDYGRFFSSLAQSVASVS